MKVFFIALLLFGMVMMPSKADAPMATNLVFLNFPEKVLKSGNLGKQTIKESSKTRIFFHYLNATGRDQVFNFKLKGKLEKYKFSNYLISFILILSILLNNINTFISFHLMFFLLYS